MEKFGEIVADPFFPTSLEIFAPSYSATKSARILL
jgi:hypothetical protein